MRKPNAFKLAAILVATAACQDSIQPTAPAADQTAADRQASSSPSSVALRLVAEGFTQPVALVHSNDKTGRLFVVDQTGVIRIIDRNGTVLAQPFLDVRAKMVSINPVYDERGLLGLAFHPRYRQNGRFYVYYNAPPRAGAFDNTSTIAEYRVSSDPNRADPSSERVLLRVDKPQSNHNGGTIAFGPKDDYLYISIGDGGGADDDGPGHVEDWYAANRGGNGQDITQNLLGNLLRIDVDARDQAGYGIPRDNPFVGKPGLDEIYAYGFRNPWRFSFDMKEDHALIAGDAGQNRWEEVDLVRKGGNYGWNVKEGAHCFNTEAPTTDRPSCPSAMPDGTPLIDPVIEYKNAAQGNGVGVVVVAGVVYRGHEADQLAGRYVFGDWSKSFFGPPTGQLFAAQRQGRGMWPVQKLTISTSPDGELHHRVLGFGQDRRGEVYLLTTDNTGPAGTTGKVFKLTGMGRHEDVDDDDNDEDD
jgi:glucose/arabinose dehydrogenase